MRDELNSERCSKFLRGLADPERLRIVQCLRDGPMAAGEIAERLKLPAANASHHLKQLRMAGLVSTKKQGRRVLYKLAKNLASGRGRLDVLDFGCCRVELGQAKQGE
jgi:ArsR family transcriptional regulator